MILPNKIFKNRRLETLVENQTSYSLQDAELHLFETYQQAEQISLSFNQPLFVSMLEGKKVMHLDTMPEFDFIPGESLIVPADELVSIDFPEASMDNPTKCLAMAISEEKIKNTVAFLNDKRAKIDDEWKFTDYNFHFTNDIAIHQIIQRLIFIFTENHPSKDFFADLMLQELIVRLLQTETKKIYTENTLQLSNTHRLAYIIQYIRKNLSKDLSIKELSSKACMSESNFHRVFKNELNISPVDFINNERIKLAVSLLKDPNRRIKDVYMECGFNSLSYFTRTFKKKENISPKEYQNLIREMP